MVRAGLFLRALLGSRRREPRTAHGLEALAPSLSVFVVALMGCIRLASAVAPNSPTPTTTGALCNVTERTTPGGTIEQTKQVQFTPNDEPGPGVALRGGTFNADVMGDKEEGGGFVARVSWDGGVRKQTGIAQLFTYQSSGEDKYTLNTLLTDMTGIASVTTPIGTEITYECFAQ